MIHYPLEEERKDEMEKHIDRESVHTFPSTSPALRLALGRGVSGTADPRHRPGCSGQSSLQLESPPATPGILRPGRGVSPLLAQVDVRRLVRSAERSCHRQRTAPPSSVHRTRAALVILRAAVVPTAHHTTESKRRATVQRDARWIRPRHISFSFRERFGNVARFAYLRGVMECQAMTFPGESQRFNPSRGPQRTACFLLALRAKRANRTPSGRSGSWTESPGPRYAPRLPSKYKRTTAAMKAP